MAEKSERDTIEQLAKRLAEQSGYGSMAYQLLEGFAVPRWITFLGANKGEVSRWFNGDPNWTINTIAAIADALNVEIRIQAIDRVTGVVFTPAGIQKPSRDQSIQTETFNPPTTFRMTAGVANSFPLTSTNPREQRVAA